MRARRSMGRAQRIYCVVATSVTDSALTTAARHIYGAGRTAATNFQSTSVACTLQQLGLHQQQYLREPTTSSGALQQMTGNCQVPVVSLEPQELLSASYTSSNASNVLSASSWLQVRHACRILETCYYSKLCTVAARPCRRSLCLPICWLQRRGAGCQRRCHTSATTAFCAAFWSPAAMSFQVSKDGSHNRCAAQGGGVLRPKDALMQSQRLLCHV